MRKKTATFPNAIAAQFHYRWSWADDGRPVVTVSSPWAGQTWQITTEGAPGAELDDFVLAVRRAGRALAKWIISFEMTGERDYAVALRKIGHDDKLCRELTTRLHQWLDFQPEGARGD